MPLVHQGNLWHCGMSLISQSISLSPHWGWECISSLFSPSMCLVSFLAPRFYCQPQLSPCQRDDYMDPRWLMTSSVLDFTFFAFQSQEYKWLMEHWATEYLYIYFEISHISPFLWDGACCLLGHSWWASSIGGDIKQSSGRVLPSPGGAPCDVLLVIMLAIQQSSKTPCLLGPLLASFYDAQMGLYMLQFASSTMKSLFCSLQQWKLLLSPTKLFIRAAHVYARKGRTLQTRTVQIYWSIQKKRWLCCWTCHYMTYWDGREHI